MTLLQILTLFSAPIGGCVIAGWLLWYTREAH